MRRGHRDKMRDGVCGGPVLYWSADRPVYVSADPRRTQGAVTIEMLAERPLVVFDAESGERDPLRRQLAERAQERGLRLVPRVETQTMVLALRFVADGVGDTLLPRAHTRAPYYPKGLSTAPLEPPRSPSSTRPEEGVRKPGSPAARRRSGEQARLAPHP